MHSYRWVERCKDCFAFIGKIFIYLFIYLSVYLFIYLFICLFYLFIYLFIYLSSYLYIYSFVCLFIYFSVYLFICLFIYCSQRQQDLILKEGKFKQIKLQELIALQKRIQTGREEQKKQRHQDLERYVRVFDCTCVRV